MENCCSKERCLRELTKGLWKGHNYEALPLTLGHVTGKPCRRCCDAPNRPNDEPAAISTEPRNLCDQHKLCSASDNGC